MSKQEPQADKIMGLNICQASMKLDAQIAKKQVELSSLKGPYETLKKEFESLSAELFNGSNESRQISCKEVIDSHINRLKEYNELRDIGLRLANMIADEKACKVKDVFEEMGYSMKD